MSSSVAMRTGRALIDASRPYAVEIPSRSWQALLLTILFLTATTAASVVLPQPLARGIVATFSGLLIVRMFILFHDAMHGAIFRRSPVARAVLSAFAVLTLTPPRVWRDTHNYHHAHTAKIVGSHIGSFPMTTKSLWAKMSTPQRVGYVLTRHPLTIAAAYFTVFMWGMCLGPFLRNPRRNVQALATFVLNVVLSLFLITRFVFATFAFAYGYPLALATAFGAYLFYAQHNFPDARIQPREDWTYTRAALESSSYMEMGPVLRYFTGSIGFHHVHHLNSMIPFYRLEEAMRAIPKLQTPGRTSLRPADIRACLRLGIWSPEDGKMVPLAVHLAGESSTVTE